MFRDWINAGDIRRRTSAGPGCSCTGRLWLLRLLVLGGQGLSCKAHRLADCFPGDRAVPLLDNEIPVRAVGDIVKHRRNRDPGTSERDVAVVNLWIDDEVLSELAPHDAASRFWGACPGYR